MRNTKRFGKVRTSEEYLTLCRLEKEIRIQKQNKKHRRYTEDVPPICLHKGGEQNAMSKVQKTAENGPFFQLDKLRQDAVAMLFNDELTDEQIAKNVHRSPRTLYTWKQDPLFKAAQEQYSRLVVKDYKNDALKKVHELLNARSEMVQLQSATTILKMSGYLSDNSTPELDEAKTRKAKAEADLAEYKANLIANPDKIPDKTIIVDDIPKENDDGTDD